MRKQSAGKKQGFRLTGRKPVKTMALLLLFVILMMTGCSDSKKVDIRIVAPLSDSELFKIGDEICSVSEAMILVTAQKKVVEDVYGKEIWSVESDGLTFEENVKSSLKDFLARMKCMTLMAADNGVTLTSEEKSQIQSCVDTYLSQLTDQEKSSLNASKEDVQDMFTSYFYYNRLMEVLTSDLDTEISDNDARIARIECIYVGKNGEDQSKRMNSILKKAREAQSFAEVAKKYNESGKISMNVSRNQLPAEVDQVVFSMADDQISDVLETESGYYIIHCVEDYDREATARHKTELIEELKEEKFTEEYDNFVENLTAQFNEKVWEKISLKDVPALSKADFFEIYKDIVK
ncbi:MAG: peptidylprolyl isomerase [Lachnospiraceae bacterium]